MTLQRISVVLPVYNEYDNIAHCLRGLWTALRETDHEILVCYDFDEDTTLKAIAEMPDAPPSLRLVKNTLGRGPQNAIKAGFSAASGDVVVTTMADLSDPPEMIPKMAEKIRAGADVVSGSRYMPGGSQEGGPLLKRTLSEIAGRSLGIIAGVATCDATSNFRAYSKRFLDMVTVEAQAGFEIALELTVKAHLLGLKVDEVPSSWVDRAAGTSRFRLWKWLPNYLRWYLRAMAAPIFVWTIFLALGVFDLAQASGAGDRATIDRAVVLVFAALGIGATLVSRRAFGRTRYIDALHAAIWMHPWHARFAHESSIWLDLLASTAASFTLIGFAIGWRRWTSFLKGAADRAAPHVNRSNTCYALMLLVLWQTRLWYPEGPANSEIDPSWQAALGHAFEHDMQAGTEIMFTFGPLGWFAEGAFIPQLFWQKCLGWELPLKLVITLFFITTIARHKGAIVKALGFLALLLPSLGFDTYYFVAIVAISVFIIDRSRRAGPAAGLSGPAKGLTGPAAGLHWIETLGLFALTLIALVKFTYFLLIGACISVAVAHAWITSSPRRALTLASVFALFLGAVWIALGQSLLHLPAYVQSSFAIASAYNEAMASEGPLKETILALVMMALSVIAMALHILGDRRDVTRWTVSGLLLVALFLAYKSGFVRHMANSITFFTFAGFATFFLFPRSPLAPASFAARARESALSFIRCACVILGLCGYGLAYNVGWDLGERLVIEWASTFASSVRSTLDLPACFALRSTELEQLRNAEDLPRIRERIGNEPVDVFTEACGTAFLNHFEWRPRPVFQSYVAYTSELSALNARFLESDRAPTWILMRYEDIDERLPCMDDGEALKILLRDWRPVMLENGFILLQRASIPRTGRPARAPIVEIEKSIHFGEEVDLSGLSGRVHLLALDIRYSFWGRLWMFLDKAPLVMLNAKFSNGESISARIVPSLMRNGAIIDPWLDNNTRWMRWYAGRENARVVKFDITVAEDRTTRFRPEIQMTVSRADDLQPDSPVDLFASITYPMFATRPDDVLSRFPAEATKAEDRDVLVVHAPSEIRFELKAGHYDFSGSYGILAAASDSQKTDGTVTDGARFAIALQLGRKRTLLLNRYLNPVDVAKDRGAQEFHVEFDVPESANLPGNASLSARTAPGPRGDRSCDWCWWSGLSLQ